jgi:hypothetical protein
MAKKSAVRDSHVLVTGSRGCGKWAVDQARRIANYLIDREVWLIVGDAEDVDEAIIDVANERKYSRITVWGAYKKMRRETKYGMNVPYNGDYLQRDDQMAQYCTHCVAVWNGYSRGTLYTFSAVERRGKKKLVYEIPWEYQIKAQPTRGGSSPKKRRQR